MIAMWLMASALSGGSVGLLGAYVVGFRMPFLGIAVAHAAMLGGVISMLLGLPVGAGAVGAAVAAAGVVAWLATGNRPAADLNTNTGILLSLTMGLTFLGMGLNRGDMTPMLGLLWGSLLFVRTADLWVMAGLTALLAGFLAVFRRPLNALLFSRALARTSGIHDRAILAIFMGIAALVIAANLQIVGGLLIYSLLTNPAAGAYAAGRTMKSVCLLSAGLGACSALLGFGASYALNLPTGACIVLASTLLYGAALATSRLGQTAPSNSPETRIRTPERKGPVSP